MKKYVAYRRISGGQNQIDSQLGLESQESMLLDFVQREGAVLVKTYTEVESGRKAKRPELEKALQECRKHKAAILISDLTRLSRDVEFLFKLKNSGLEIRACDRPEMSTIEFGLMAILAQDYSDRVRVATKRALAKAKQRGVKLGNPKNLPEARKKALGVMKQQRSEFDEMIKPVLQELADFGVRSFAGMAKALNIRGIKTIQNKDFSAMGVKRIVERVDIQFG